MKILNALRIRPLSILDKHKDNHCSNLNNAGFDKFHDFPYIYILDKKIKVLQYTVNYKTVSQSDK